MSWAWVDGIDYSPSSLGGPRQRIPSSRPAWALSETLLFLLKKKDWALSSVVENLPRMLEVHDSIPTTGGENDKGSLGL